MGFYIGFNESRLSKYILYVLVLLCSIQNIVLFISRFVGIFDITESHNHHHKKPSKSPPLWVVLTRDFLVVKKFRDIQRKDLPTSCAVCVTEFTGDDKVRCLKNCRHIFHEVCLDRWMNQVQGTCPLCRSPILPLECQDDYKKRVAADLHSFYNEALVIQDF